MKEVEVPWQDIKLYEVFKCDDRYGRTWRFKKLSCLGFCENIVNGDTFFPFPLHMSIPSDFILDETKFIVERG